MAESESVAKQLDFRPTAQYFEPLTATFEELRVLSASIMKSAQDNLQITQSQIDELKSQLQLDYTRLRSLNRIAYLDKLAVKATTQTVKEDMDQKNVQLQNLKCENGYLKRAIARCRTNRSKYESIPIMPEAEFLLKAPELYKLLPEDEDDPDRLKHYRMLQRLKFEEAERIRLEKEREMKRQRKTELQQKLAEQKVRLDEVDTEIQKFFKDSESLRNIFRLPNGVSAGDPSPSSATISTGQLTAQSSTLSAPD